MSKSRDLTGLSLWRTVKAVAWSFVGLRARSEFEQDVQTLNPLHIIAVALVGVLGLLAYVFFKIINN